MSEMLRRMMLTAGTALCLALFVSGCEQKTTEPKAPKPLVVTTVKTTAADEPKWRMFNGRTESGDAVEVRAQVSGVLTEVLFSEGSRVKKGDVLYRIDRAPFEAALRTAQANEKAARAQLEKAERELRRAKGLFSAGAGSQKTYDDARSAAESARALVSQRSAQTEVARVDLGWTDVRAPADGEIGRSDMKAGALVMKSTTLLASITQKEDVRAVFAPAVSDLDGRVTTANRVEVKKAGGEWTPVKLDFVEQSIDPKTGTIMMRAPLPASMQVKPGDFVKIRLMTDVRKNAVRIPKSAVRQEPDGSYTVFVMKDGRAEARTVELDLWDGPERLVVKGLDGGAELITSGLKKLRSGMAVRPGDAAKKKH